MNRLSAVNRDVIDILVTEPDNYSEQALAIYRTLGAVRTGPFTREDLLSQAPDVDVLVIRLGHRIDAELISRACRLRVVVSPTTGLTHIDLAAAGQRNVAVLNLSGENAFLEQITATAELAWGLIICMSRRLPEAFEHTGVGGWNRDVLRGRELQGRTLGIVGLGRLGRMVANYGLAFRMRVLGFDPDPDVVAPTGIERVRFDNLLAVSDVLSVHASLTDASRGFIDKRAFARMKEGVYFVNTARGELIDESALLSALNSGRVAAAAMDVLSGEPFPTPDLPPDNPLVRFARKNPGRLLLTPHIGGATSDAMAKTEVFMAQKLRSWLEQTTQSNCEEVI